MQPSEPSTPSQVAGALVRRELRGSVRMKSPRPEVGPEDSTPVSLRLSPIAPNYG